MSKDKNKDFHDNKDIKDKLHVESVILDTPNILDQLPISSVVKMHNGSEETKITIDNMINVGENKIEILPEVVEEMNHIEKVTINIVNKDKKANSLDSFRSEFDNFEAKKENIEIKSVKEEIKNENPLEQLKDSFSKISIVDISKNKSAKNNSSHKSSPLDSIKSAVEKAVAFSPVSIENIEEKAFDSLIYLGGGFIAATSIASKTLAGVGSSFIKK